MNEHRFDGPAARGLLGGRTYRAYYKYALAATGNTVTLRFQANLPFLLQLQSLVEEAGHVQCQIYAGSTSGGTWGSPQPVNRKCRLPGTPAISASNTWMLGGTFSGGAEVEVLRVKCAGATGQQSTVNGSQTTERGLPVGDYFMVLTSINGACSGVYYLEWEELWGL